MTSKSEILYRELLRRLTEMAEQENILLDPEVIIKDFELASIKAIRAEFPGTRNQGCLFHLCQSVYLKINENGLANRYGTDEEFSLLLRKLPALAFLPVNEIPNSFAEIRNQFPAEPNDILEWFDEYYVNGRMRLLQPQRRWSVFENNRLGYPRTQNSVEAFHRKWNAIVGSNHVGVYKMIREIRKEQNETEIQIERIIRVIPAPNRRTNIEIQREETLQNIINTRNQRTLDQFLRAIAHRMVF